jgi:CheY-like chemotaxis protein
MRKKLLLADDSITIQKVVELTFPSDEFEVVTAGNGRIAVDKAMTFLPDVVLCDVIMPQLDGYQVCEALRASEQLKNVPILLLNGAFEPYDAERAKSVGALGNVSKPFDPPALVARVKEILAERQTASFARPTQPMSLEAIAEATEAAAPAEAAATVPHDLTHEYSYDESETHPVSTVEVPMDVREMAARSLSLDAPVFAPAEPDVLTTEAEPSDFSETLHGPLDEELPAAAPQEVEAIQEIETSEEIEPVAATGEIEAPAAAPAPVEAASEAFEFEPDTARSGEIQMPPTLPAAPAPKIAEPVEEFAGEREFDPAELESVTAEPEVINTSPDAISAPEELPVAKTEPTPEVMAVPEPVAPPTPPPPTPPVLDAPAPVPAPPAPVPAAPVTAGAFDNLVGTAPSAPAPAPAAPLPSAEVAVPVDMVQQIAQRVISQVSERVIREIAWDVIPGLAEKLIKAEIERIKARAESERD